MPSTINANNSTGLVYSSDTSGQLLLQTNGTTALTVDSSQQVSISKLFASSGNISGLAGSNPAMSVGTATNATNAVNATNATNASFSTTQAIGDNSTAIATTAFVHSSFVGLGFGGTNWVSSGSYGNGAVYTNSNPYPIALSFLVSTSYGSGNVTVYVNGQPIGSSASNNGGQQLNMFVIVPPSGTWQVVGTCYGAWILQ